MKRLLKSILVVMLVILSGVLTWSVSAADEWRVSGEQRSRRGGQGACDCV